MVAFSQLQTPSQAPSTGIDPALMALIMQQKQGGSGQLGNLLGQIGPQMTDKPGSDGGLELSDTSGKSFDPSKPATDEDQFGDNSDDEKKKNGWLAETGEIGANAAKGAKMGSAFGPWGTAIGALLGGVKGFFG